MEDASDAAISEPSLIVDQGAASAVIKAAAGGTGVILLDQRRMPSLSRCGAGDPQTAALLNAVAAGHPILTPEAQTGRTLPRSFPIGVIGTLTLAECENLQTATRESLAATVFVPGVLPPAGGDGGPLGALAKSIHDLAAASAVELRFSQGGVSVLAAAADRWLKPPQVQLQPIDGYVAQLPDLARRFAVAIHLIDSTTVGKIVPEISAASVGHAVRLVDGYVAPVAHELLGAVSSASAVEQDALRVVSALRRHTSLSDPTVEKRELQRSLQTSTPGPRFKAALRLLEKLILVSPGEPPPGRRGEYLAVAPAIHA